MFVSDAEIFDFTVQSSVRPAQPPPPPPLHMWWEVTPRKRPERVGHRQPRPVATCAPWHHGTTMAPPWVTWTHGPPSAQIFTIREPWPAKDQYIFDNIVNLFYMRIGTVGMLKSAEKPWLLHLNLYKFHVKSAWLANLIKRKDSISITSELKSVVWVDWKTSLNVV